MADFGKKLTESDAYLQLLIDQSQKLEEYILNSDDPQDKLRCQDIISKVNNLLESIKHTIILLQVSISIYCSSVPKNFKLCC